MPTVNKYICQNVLMNQMATNIGGINKTSTE